MTPAADQGYLRGWYEAWARALSEPLSPDAPPAPAAPSEDYRRGYRRGWYEGWAKAMGEPQNPDALAGTGPERSIVPLMLRPYAAMRGIQIVSNGGPARFICGQGAAPVAGLRGSVETAGQLRSRYTMTRIATLGIFALAAKKKRDERQLFLTVEGDGVAFVFEVAADPRNQTLARRLASFITSAR